MALLTKDKHTRFENELSIIKMQCPHVKSHKRRLVQIQNETRYEIIACEICASIALRSDGNFFQIEEKEAVA